MNPNVLLFSSASLHTYIPRTCPHQNITNHTNSKTASPSSPPPPQHMTITPNTRRHHASTSSSLPSQAPLLYNNLLNSLFPFSQQGHIPVLYRSSLSPSSFIFHEIHICGEGGSRSTTGTTPCPSRLNRQVKTEEQLLHKG